MWRLRLRLGNAVKVAKDNDDMAPTDLCDGYGYTPIERLPNLPRETPQYVCDQVEERLHEVMTLPAEAGSILESCTGTIIDVGPGEGISAMALARLASRAVILGIEMDRDHLVSAWPLCQDLKNLRLFWGAVPSSPSNPRVKAGAPLAPTRDMDADICTVLFTWTGMSRRDIFAPSAPWYHAVQESCVLVLPRVWRLGMQALPSSSRGKVESLCDTLGVPRPGWRESTALPGFARTKFLALDKPVRARGWLLWLTGLFDSADITLWDTLTDRWTASPKYQLPEVELELEVAIGYR